MQAEYMHSKLPWDPEDRKVFESLVGDLYPSSCTLQRDEARSLNETHDEIFTVDEKRLRPSYCAASSIAPHVRIHCSFSKPSPLGNYADPDHCGPLQ